MKLEFEKVGQGCDICIAKSKENCGRCERNPNLHKLVDNFRRPSKKPPEPPMKNVQKITESNKRELAAWGIHVQPEAPSDLFQAPIASIEEQARPSPPPDGLEI